MKGRKKLISDLVGRAYAGAITVDGGRLRSIWIARTRETLPDDATIDQMQHRLEDWAFETIKDAYSAHATGDAIEANRPSLSFMRLDDQHLVVRIEFAGPEKSVGDAALISEWGVLQALDREIRLDELQGIPREHWFPLRVNQ